ncbi:hypothetical protein HMPREF0973_00773 [Prevotella veroralis F0319]|uniref:Uncharacterized protein n=1 Tax=Prevotella veroralis F0319 TaxID=649761 RepID=C9MME3_9BACT|nr:hypothetical protein HMPREF0973_00773 [Prevotella veroralis F0319]
MGNNTIYSPSPCGEGMGGRLLSRDRRPRLSATTFHLTLQAAFLMRTDEGVCPYFKALSGLQNSSLISSHEALLPLGEAGWGFWTRASVPTLRQSLQSKRGFL